MELDKKEGETRNKPTNSPNDDLDIVEQQSKMIKTKNNFVKHRPCMVKDQEKVYFDSSDYWKRKDGERKHDQEIQKAVYDNLKEIESKGDSIHKHELIKRDPKKGFDSAEFFMQKDLEKKEQENEEKLEQIQEEG